MHRIASSPSPSPRRPRHPYCGLAALATALLLGTALAPAGAQSPVAPGKRGVPPAPLHSPVDTQVTTPRAFLGFTPGDPCRLADYDQSWKYFHKIAGQTRRMRLLDIGRSAEGQPTMLAVISSEANLREMDRWKVIAKTLADGRIPEAEARRLAAEGKVVVWIDGGMHATEIGSAQHTINLGYDLVAREDEPYRSFREKAIILLCPSINPDGQRLVADWFNAHYGTPQEGTPLPSLYQKYSGHDNNRDWYMLNLPETRNVTQVLYQDWYPQIVYNHHQSGMFPERMFIPPYDEPLNPNTPPLVTREINALGTEMHTQFTEEGKTGVISQDTYSAWWNGGMRTTPWFHNVVGILTEVAHESPYTAHYTVGAAEQEPTVFYPDPYRGGEWRFADTVAYMNTGSISLLRWSVEHAEEVQLNRWRMAHAAIQAGETAAPYGFVVPMTPQAGQRDPNTAALFLERMRLGGIDIRFARKPFRAEGKSFPAGTAVLLSSQPNRPFLLDMCLPQHHPMRTLGPGGPPIRPYDIAGWTLTLQMGVATTTLDTPAAADMLASLSPPAAMGINAPVPPALPAVPAGGAYLLPADRNVSFVAVNRLLKAGIGVQRWTAPRTAGETVWPAGTFVVPASDRALAALRAIAADLRLPVSVLPDVGAAGRFAGRNAAVDLAAPRVSTYDPYGGDIAQGWAQYVLEEFEFPHRTITNPDIRQGNLNAATDSLILTAFPNVRNRVVGARRASASAGGGATAAINRVAPLGSGDQTGGLGPGYLGGPAPKTIAPEVAARLEGIGSEGEANIRRFVENGGTLIALDAAVAHTVEMFHLPVREVTADSKFYSPGSVFRIETDPASPLCWGLPPQIDIFFDRGAAWEASSRVPLDALPSGGAFARYPDSNPLESGWIIEDQVIRGRSAGISYRVGKGRVIVYGFGVTFRGQPHQGYPLLFNALYGMP